MSSFQALYVYPPPQHFLEIQCDKSVVILEEWSRDRHQMFAAFERERIQCTAKEKAPSRPGKVTEVF